MLTKVMSSKAARLSGKAQAHCSATTKVRLCELTVYNYRLALQCSLDTIISMSVVTKMMADHKIWQ